MDETTLKNIIQLYEYYKSLGEKAMTQISDEALLQQPDEKSNSISVIVKHLHGNMLSRWTDFLTTDGEKEWRERDEEFEERKVTREQVNQWWEEGWNCTLSALKSLRAEDLTRTVYIRNMGQSVMDAIFRQLAHYAYHVGQIVYLARWLNEGNWTSLTIPKGQSKQYNQERFDKPKEIKHFTEEKK